MIQLKYSEEIILACENVSLACKEGSLRLSWVKDVFIWGRVKKWIKIGVSEYQVILGFI